MTDNDRTGPPNDRSLLGALIGAGFGGYQGVRSASALDTWLPDTSPPEVASGDALTVDGNTFIDHPDPHVVTSVGLGVAGACAGYLLGGRNAPKSTLLAMTAMGAWGAAQAHTLPSPSADFTASGSGHDGAAGLDQGFLDLNLL